MDNASRNNKPRLIISQELKEKERDNYRNNRATKKSRWFQASPGARQVVNHMRAVTPAGAAEPWRSGPSVEAVDVHLDDGVPLEDLLDHVSWCARLVERGKVAPKWWYPSHLFGPKTMPRWRADVAQLHADMKAAEANQRELERLSASAAAAAPKLSERPVVDIALLSLQRDLEAMLARGLAAAASKDSKDADGAGEASA
jgi:hypothetical protein